MSESFADKAMKNLQETANKLLNQSNDLTSKIEMPNNIQRNHNWADQILNPKKQEIKTREELHLSNSLKTKMMFLPIPVSVMYFTPNSTE